MDAGGFRGHKISTSNPAMVEGIPPDQVDSSRMVSVLGLKLDHDKNEFLFNLEKKFKTTTRMWCKPRVEMSFH